MKRVVLASILCAVFTISSCAFTLLLLVRRESKPTQVKDTATSNGSLDLYVCVHQSTEDKDTHSLFFFTFYSHARVSISIYLHGTLIVSLI